MSVSKLIRSLALAAAVVAPLAAGSAYADQERVPPGATASGAWVSSNGRTMLASPAGFANGDLLSQSGATGGGGQHN